ncbi:hypothetical protein ACSSS7_001109 [Eimeria intestinalis]
MSGGLHADFEVRTIGLDYQPLSTQIECHDWLSELDLLALRRVDAEVGSSTMPHKINPIAFENAEGNLGLSTAMLRFFSGKLPVSRLQRDLSDSTCLRSVGCAMGYMLVGLKSCIKGLEKTTVNCEAACAELANHWEVLGEPIQTVLRRYEQEKRFRSCCENITNLAAAAAAAAAGALEIITSMSNFLL